MKFLILLILIPFLALAESGVTNSFKIAGNPSTSKNLVNGSFESGANTGWTVSAGTLTATTAQAIQGVDSGLWTITGAGTIDLCATPTGLASTDLLASGWVKSTSTDLQVCSVVNSVENGCTPLGTITGWKKVEQSATYASGNFCFRLKSVASGLITAYVDDVKLEPLENQQVSTVEQEGVIAYGNAGTETITANVTNINFNTIDTTSLSKVGTWTSNSVYTALVKQEVVVSAIAAFTVSNGTRLRIFKNGSDISLAGEYSADAGSKTISRSLTLNAGEYISIRSEDTRTLANSPVHRISITATAVRDNVIASWQAPSDIGEIKYLPQNIAPQGFLPANGSIIGLSSGSHQGNTYYDLYNVLWNVAQTTAGEPYIISSAKGASASADWSAGKTIKIDESGLFTRAYLSGTSGAVGAKQLDAFQDHTHATNILAANGGTSSGGLTPFYNDRAGTPYVTTTIVPGLGRTSSETRPTNVAKYAFIRYATAQPTLLALPTSKENVYSAVITSAGAITSQNASWLTSITKTGAGLYTIDYTKLGLTSAPSISSMALVNSLFVQTNGIPTTTSASIRIVSDAGTPTDSGFNLVLQKQGADYTAPGVFISNINPDGFNKTSGQVGLVESFSFSFGTTNATTVCSASPCSYLDQIGNNVTSVTRSGVGDYVANFSKTFSKIKCFNVFNFSIAGNPIISQPTNNINGNSVGIRTQRFLDGALTDSFGTIYCQGY